MSTDSSPVQFDSNPQPRLSSANREAMIQRRLELLSPWRMNIQITEQITTENYLSLKGDRDNACHRNRSQARTKFLSLLDSLYPDQMEGKCVLDCGCNAGGYCFWARERKTQFCYGFDVREHWIKQAKFVRSQRKVFASNRIQFEVEDLYCLPTRNLQPFDLVLFKGLFHHLAEPISGLRIAADLAKELIVFSTSFLWGRQDGSIVVDRCEQELLHGGIGSLGWLPTGPGVCADVLKNLGFDEIKLTQLKQVKARPERGRLEIVAAREKGRLKGISGKHIASC